MQQQLRDTWTKATEVKTKYQSQMVARGPHGCNPFAPGDHIMVARPMNAMGPYWRGPFQIDDVGNATVKFKRGGKMYVENIGNIKKVKMRSAAA